nr:immunoglobulin light chain junction region [Macaca mulatta]MOW00020.1 immunoglobulin light chain junction region [Macaca mulatta]
DYYCCSFTTNDTWVF